MIHDIMGDELHYYPALLPAAKQAATWYDGQFRTVAGHPPIPYIVNPIEVAYRLAVWDPRAEDWELTAALFHDVLEGTNATETEIAHFSFNALTVVRELTDVKGVRAFRQREQMFRAVTYSSTACLIRIADKVSNVEGMATGHWDIERKREYLAFCHRIVAVCLATLSTHWDNVAPSLHDEWVSFTEGFIWNNLNTHYLNDY